MKVWLNIVDIGRQKLSKLIINCFEYDYLVGKWPLPKQGAAVNQVYEFLRKNRLIDCTGEATELGREQIRLYEIIEKSGVY